MRHEDAVVMVEVQKPNCFITVTKVKVGTWLDSRIKWQQQQGRRSDLAHKKNVTLYW